MAKLHFDLDILFAAKISSNVKQVNICFLKNSVSSKINLKNQLPSPPPHVPENQSVWMDAFNFLAKKPASRQQYNFSKKKQNKCTTLSTYTHACTHVHASVDYYSQTNSQYSLVLSQKVVSCLAQGSSCTRSSS